MWCARKSRQNRRVNRKLTQPGGGRMAGIGPIGRIGLMGIALHKQRSNLAPTALQSSAATEAARASTATADSLAPPPGCDLGATFTRPRMSPTPRSAKYGATHSCHHLPGWRITSPSVIIAPPRRLRWKPHTSSHHRAAIGVPAGSTMVRRTSQTSRTGQTALQCNSAAGGLLRLLSSSHHRAAFGGSHTHHRTTAPP